MQDYQRIAQAFIDQLHKDVDNLIRAILCNHHLQHEPGGTDRVLIPVEGLKNVTITSPSAGQALVIATDLESWENGSSGGGGLSEAATYPTTYDMSAATPEVTIASPTILVLPDGTLFNDSSAVAPVVRVAYKPKGAAYWEMKDTLAEVAGDPGPTNLWGDSIVTTVAYGADTSCTITLSTGDTHTFGAGGGTHTNTGLTDAWDEGDQISMTITDLGAGGTYITATIGYQYA